MTTAAGRRRAAAQRGPEVKTADSGPGDRLLLTLDAQGGAEILFLTAPSSSTRRRLRRFCRAVIESPSWPALEESGQ